MAASDFICEGIDRSPVCPGYLSRSVRPHASLVQLSLLKKSAPGVDTCAPTKPTHPPCPAGGLCRTSCPFADPCSPCYRTAHERVPRQPRYDPCEAHRCEPCLPAVNTAPNLPFPQMSPWRPAPPALRLTSDAQLPSKPCLPDASVPCNPCPLPLPCDRPCCARSLPVPPRGRTLTTRKPVIYGERRRCRPPRPVPVYTCSTIGTRKANDRITTYYNYSGYLDVPESADAKCSPVIPCHLFSNYVHAGCARKPIVWRTANVKLPLRTAPKPKAVEHLERKHEISPSSQSAGCSRSCYP